ncbi:MAG TPA: KTSC domain-containing protein [Bacteroidota bacterium]|nr:KTSC domain-containing protein [Bacteroidota bacterium]
MKLLNGTLLLALYLLGVVTACGDGVKLEMTPQSTAITKVEYWPESETRRFVVYFTSNPSQGYDFQGLERETWEAWLNADSKGGFYKSVIRPNPMYNTDNY